MRERYDAIVVGAGPAGSTAARYAAREGVSVLLLEKDRDIGMPVRCGEAVSNRSLEELVAIDPRWIAATIRRFRLIAPDGGRVEPSLDGHGYVLERRIFDYDLARLAAEEGAEVLTKAYAGGLLREKGNVAGVTATVNGEERIFRGRVVVGADGVESRVGRWAGIDTTTHMRDMECCAQMTLTNAAPEPETCEFYFGREIAPHGYLWIFPKGNGIANVGVGISGEAAKKRSPLSRLREFVSRKFPAAGVLTTVAGGVPCAPTLPTIVKDNVLLVGDAAHQVNPISGGGITSGMIAGRMAGEAIAAALRSGDLSRLDEYPRAWEKRNGAKHRMYHKMKTAVYRIPDEALNSIARRMSRKPADRQTIWELFKTALADQPAIVWEMVKVFGLGGKV